jgi:hypothetical protein
MRSKELSVEIRYRIVLRHRSGELQKMYAALNIPKNTVGKSFDPPRLFLELASQPN